MKLTPQQAAVNAVACPKGSGRDALETVHVVTNGEASTATSTDSYRLLSVTTASTEPEAIQTYRASTVLAASKIAKINKSNEVDMATCEHVPGKFPDWETIKPTKAPAASLKIDRKYLMDLLKAIDAPSVTLEMSGDNFTALVLTASEDGHEYYGLLMPLRG